MVRKLVLHARDATHRLADQHTLVNALHEIGLLGDILDDQPQAYYAGEEFLSLLTFLGCSPHVDLLPADAGQRNDGRFCHLRLQLDLPQARFRAAAGKLRPRCPQCRHEVDEWEALVAQYANNPAVVHHCPKCNTAIPVPELNWRQSAGCGRWFIEVWNIHPHEAVPSERLLEVIEGVTGVACRYFYQ